MAGIAVRSGTLKYNGFEFPPAYNCHVTVKPVPDSTGRTEKYLLYTITIECFLHPGVNGYFSGSDVNTGVPQTAALLSQYGRTLIFRNAGYGNLYEVNTILQDVVYGPKPQIIELKQMTGAQSVRLVWVVEVGVLACDVFYEQNAHATPILEMTYSSVWNIEETGLTTRTISGYLEVAATRSATNRRAVTRWADLYRDNFVAPRLSNFSRTSTWNQSNDKRTITFTITDREIPSDNPYFPGVIRPDVSYTLSNDVLGTTRWMASLTGSIEVVQGAPRQICWLAFAAIAKNYMKQASKAVVGTRQTDTRGGLTAIVSLSITEHPFLRRMDFSLSWTLLCDLKTFWVASGLWTQVSGATWDQWQQSINRAQSYRGHAQLGTSATDDQIANACEPGQLTVNNASFIGLDTVTFPLWGVSCPTPANSWIQFQNATELMQDSKVITHNMIGRPEQDQGYVPSPVSEHAVLSVLPAIDPPRLQRRGSSHYMVRMRGYATRIKYPVPVFELTTFGGKNASRAGKRSYKSTVIANNDGQKIYYATWDDFYYLEDAPDSDIAEVHGEIDYNDYR